MLLTKIIAVIILLLVCIEDMRYRAVHWFWFPLLTVILLISKLADSSNSVYMNMLLPAAFNISFILIQFLLVTIYFSIKNNRLINITNGLLGWGDICFIASISFYLSPINFVLFYIVSLIIILIGWLLYSFFNQNKQQRIPLAGLQAVLFVFILLTSCLKPSVKLTNDDLLLYLIN